MSGVLGASFLLINDVVGGGMMTLPNAVKDCGGIVLFNIIHTIIIIIATSTILILGYCSDINQTSTYQETVLKVCGKTVYRISTLSIILYSFGSCVLCLLVIADQWEEFFLFTIRHQYCDIQPLYLNNKMVMSVTSCVFILPLCFCKNVDFLIYPRTNNERIKRFLSSILSRKNGSYQFVIKSQSKHKVKTEKYYRIPGLPFSVVFGVVGVTYIAILLPVKYHTEDNVLQKHIQRSHEAKWTDVLLGIPAIIYSYQVHMCTIPIYSSMKQASFKKFTYAVAITILTSATFYSIIAIYGYLSFGDHVTTDIFLSFKPTPDVSVAVLLMAVKVYTSYPIMLFCGRQGIESMWMDIRNISDIDLDKNEKTRRIFVTLIWFLGSLFIAVFVPNIGIIVRYLGIIAFLLILIFPGICLLTLKSMPSLIVEVMKIFLACSIITLGVFITVTTIFQSVITDGNAKKIGADVSKYTC